MFLFVDTAVVLLVLGFARSGWRRGLTSAAIDLVGFGVAAILAVRFSGLLAELYLWIGLSEGWARLAGGLTIFIPIVIGTAAIGWTVGRVVRLPGLRMTDRVLGLAFGILTAAVVLAVGLVVAKAAPVPETLTEAVERSPTAGAFLDLTSPVTDPLQRFAERHVGHILPGA